LIVGLLLGAALANAGVTPATAPALRARLAPQQITVGDPVKVEIEVDLPPSERWGTPAIDPRLRNWGEAEVLASQRPQPVTGAAGRYRLELMVTAFRPGRVVLPPLAVAVARPREEETPGQAPLLFRTPPLSFDVRSVLPAQGEATPKPPTPPQPLPAGSAFWWTAGGLALACLLAAGALLWRRRALALARPAAPPLPPFGQFLRELTALAAEPSPERVHTGISLALRHLVAALLGFPAGERTTTEIDHELRHGRLTAPLRRRLLDLLRRCDEVKFARVPATRDAARERLATAREIGEEIQGELLPQPGEEGSGAGEAVA
jgi:hypothetical protein